MYLPAIIKSVLSSDKNANLSAGGCMYVIRTDLAADTVTARRAASTVPVLPGIDTQDRLEGH